MMRGMGVDKFLADARTKKAALAELAKDGANALAALPEIIAGIAHDHHEVTHAAIEALDAIEPTAAAAGLVAAATEPATRRDGMKALFQLASHHDRPGYLEGTPSPVVEALRELVVPMLIDTLASEADHYTRAHAALPLGIYGAGDDRAFAALQAAARPDQHPHVREWTAHGLAYFGDRALSPLFALIQCAGDGADDAAAYAISRIATPRAIKMLSSFAETYKTVKRRLANQCRDYLASIAKRAARKTARAAKQPVAKTAAANKPAAKKSAAKPPAKKPVAKTSAAKPAAKKSAAKPAAMRPAAKKPATAKPAAKKRPRSPRGD